jgi:hypothetical protein
MRLVPTAQDPRVLTYLTLRKVVGFVAILLPFAVALPLRCFRGLAFEPSISCYYYTGARNVFVGSLCAIAMFMVFTRGYDFRDEIAGIFSGTCALGVAFFPTDPCACGVERRLHVGKIHLACAALLFLTLAYFCFRLFTMSAKNRELTPRKIVRNRFYYGCGSVIIFSIIMIVVLSLRHVTYLPGHFGSDFVFETTALIAFGVAWLVKGEFILKDQNSQPSKTAATDGQATPINTPHN